MGFIRRIPSASGEVRFPIASDQPSVSELFEMKPPLQIAPIIR
jgi:hypothetical protein